MIDRTAGSARETLDRVAEVLAPIDRAGEYIAYIEACPYPENGRPTDVYSDRQHRGLLSVRDILADPELCRPLEYAVPRLACRGRSSMLWAREKMGKSTLARAAAAAKSTGSRFLGEDTDPGSVLYVALEEAIGDTPPRERETA